MPRDKKQLNESVSLSLKQYLLQDTWGKTKAAGEVKVLSEHPLLCGHRKGGIQEYSLRTPCVLLSRQTTPDTANHQLLDLASAEACL